MRKKKADPCIPPVAPVYSKKVGDYLIIEITCVIGTTFIAEVISVEPLRLKVAEAGPYSNLKDGDFIIQERDTVTFQLDQANETNVFMEAAKASKHEIVCGLKSLGIEDGELHSVGIEQ